MHFFQNILLPLLYSVNCLWTPWTEQILSNNYYEINYTPFKRRKQRPGRQLIYVHIVISVKCMPYMISCPVPCPFVPLSQGYCLQLTITTPSSCPLHLTPSHSLPDHSTCVQPRYYRGPSKSEVLFLFKMSSYGSVLEKNNLIHFSF